MKMNIFAVKDDTVQTFYVIIDEKKIKDVQSKIDVWNGKGEIKEVKAFSLSKYLGSNKKIEVVSKKYAGKGQIFFYCCPSVETVDMYNYKFYEYRQHPLSKLCDTLLKDYESLDLSKHIGQLVNWASDDAEEMLFVNQLISTLKFKKVSADDIIKSNLTTEEKRTLLQRMMEAIKNITQPRKATTLSKSYEEEVNKKIHNMEMINSGFYGRELKGKDFKYTFNQRKIVKRKILSTLPKTEQLIK